MATVTYTGSKPVTGQGDSVIHTTTLTTADPTSSSITGYEDYADVTVQAAAGTWGGATLVVEGSLDGGTTWFTLTDLQGTSISKTADFGEGVAEAVPRLRVRLSSVGVGASVPVFIYMRKAK